MVKKKGPHNPAQGYEGRSPLSAMATMVRRIILSPGRQQAWHGVLHHALDRDSLGRFLKKPGRLIMRSSVQAGNHFPLGGWGLAMERGPQAWDP
jgi:hypothetical protein